MIYVLSGGQTGATLTVTSSGAGTITVSNTSLGKSYSKSVTAGGSAVFKGLQTGTWAIKLTDGSKTSTKNITITSDYSTSIAYFSATISITYPAKSTCVVKNSSGTTVASNTNTGTSAKTWTATVNATGTYTVTATATDGSGKTKSTTVSITAGGQTATVTLTYQMILFDNGVIGGIKWNSSEVDDATYCINSVSDVIHLSGTVYDNGAVLVVPSATRGISSAIDLTNYNKVNVRVKQVLNNTGTAKIYVGTSALGNQTATANIALTAGQTSSLDISSVTGSKYISIYVCPTSGTYGNMINVKFDKVWLE